MSQCTLQSVQKWPTGHQKRSKEWVETTTSLIINPDSSKYAEGHMLVDDGAGRGSAGDNEYTFWKFRFAEKALNFWLESGDFNYFVTADIGIARYENLNQVVILGGKYLIPDINETINDYTACSGGRKLDPVAMGISYNDTTDTIVIQADFDGR